ncbi:MAG TPA: HypC/HybG/HupF family hydrogenase formation chaperone [Nitrospiria bacterium]|nr:HypC/HybG/HupF family hydrogenase formation chaperone [Nitrospiria bacterium]
MCLAIPGRIVAVNGAEGVDRAGRVQFGGIVKDVSLAFVPEAAVGDYVIVHVGFAIARVDEAEAARALEYIAELGEFGERD